MKLKFVLGGASILAACLMFASVAHADTFDVRKNVRWAIGRLRGD